MVDLNPIRFETFITLTFYTHNLALNNAHACGIHFENLKLEINDFHDFIHSTNIANAFTIVPLIRSKLKILQILEMGDLEIILEKVLVIVPSYILLKLCRYSPPNLRYLRFIDEAIYNHLLLLNF